MAKATPLVEFTMKKAPHERDSHHNLESAQGDFAKLYLAIEKAVSQVLARDRADSRILRLDTDTIARELTQKAYELWNIAYAEKNWNFIKSCDKLPELLLRAVDDPNWDFRTSEERSMWAPDDSSSPIPQGDPQ